MKWFLLAYMSGMWSISIINEYESFIEEMQNLPLQTITNLRIASCRDWYKKNLSKNEQNLILKIVAVNLLFKNGQFWSYCNSSKSPKWRISFCGIFKNHFWNCTYFDASVFTQKWHTSKLFISNDYISKTMQRDLK